MMVKVDRTDLSGGGYSRPIPSATGIDWQEVSPPPRDDDYLEPVYDEPVEEPKPEPEPEPEPELETETEETEQQTEQPVMEGQEYALIGAIVFVVLASAFMFSGED